MEFIVKTTLELSDAERQGIISLFNEVFDKHRDITEFNNQFLNNPLGYSFHCMIKEDGLVVGHNAGIPNFYLVNGERRLFVCNMDTMIGEHHRGIDNLYDMFETSYQNYKNAGVSFVYGFPNDNSYQLLTQLSFMEDIGKLDTYCLPYRIGGIKRGLSFLNPLSKLFCRIWLGVSEMLASDKGVTYHIEKEEESFNTTRYKRMDGHYSIVKTEKCSFVYKIMTFDEVRTAFIVDVIGKTGKNFCSSVQYLLVNERQNFDLILYPGHLKFSHCGLVRFPRKFEPKHFNFTGKELSGSTDLQNTAFNIDNWDINLSNYDLL